MHDMGVIRCSGTDLTNRQLLLAHRRIAARVRAFSHIDRVGFMNT